MEKFVGLRGDSILVLRADPPEGWASSWSQFLHRRKVIRWTTLGLLVVLLIFSSHPATRPDYSLLFDFDAASRTPLHPQPRILPRSLVGPRMFTNLYGANATCSSTEFIDNLGKTKIAETGASRTPADMEGYMSVALPPFQYSFEFAGSCPQPHIFTSEEACDLLSSFGGFYMRGDSFMRHQHNALLMLLRGRLDGALVDLAVSDRCHGEAMFDDRAECRAYILKDTQGSGEPICDGAVHAWYSQAELADQWDVGYYYDWLDNLPAIKRMRSPIFYQSSGIHYQYNLETSVNYILPVIDLVARSWPAPLSLWAGLHAPPDNQPEQYVGIQGKGVVMVYNEKIARIINFRSPGLLREGAMKMIPWYNVTDGAVSYDGAHYSYQVNQEKVQLLLNLLDIAWGEIVEAGGLVDRALS